MKLRRFQDVDLKGKRVLLRVDYNVTFQDGDIEDNTRMLQTLPTLKHLIEQGAKIIIISHLGRPEGKVVDELKLDKVARHLSELLEKPVQKLAACIGPEVEKTIQNAKNGDIVMLENIRFYPQEEENNSEFSKALASLAEIYVSDSFGTAHRAHASTEGVAQYLPSYAGFLMQKEVDTLSSLISNAKKPLTLIVGGAKIDTKIGVISNFITKADYFLIGGGLANTFLAAQGFDVGKSLYEPNKIEVARETMLETESFREDFVLPKDAIVADEIDDNAKTLDIPVEDVEGEMKILDIGTLTIQTFTDIIQKSKTIVWNGPVGLFEKRPFSKGTKAIALALVEATQNDTQTIIGGGDTIDAIHHFGLSEESFTHVSTGGGAMLEFLEGRVLPGIEVLLEKA